jgi:hypothetical protein
VVAEVVLDGSQYGVSHFRFEETILTGGVGDAPFQLFCVVVVPNAHILFFWLTTWNIFFETPRMRWFLSASHLISVTLSGPVPGSTWSEPDRDRDRDRLLNVLSPAPQSKSSHHLQDMQYAN